MESLAPRSRSSFVDVAQRHALSRAGAIAELLARGTARRVLGMPARIALLMGGSALIAAAVAVILWNDLGPGPLDVFIGAVRTRTGVPLSVAVWLTVGSMLVVAWMLGRRPGVGSVLSPLAVGPIMQAVRAGLDAYDVPDAVLVQLVVQLVAVAVIGIGAGAMIVSGLGAGSGELLAAAASDRSGHPEPRVRLACELSWLGIGVVLGGPFGVGTILLAVTIGPAVAGGYRLVDNLVVRTRHDALPEARVLVADAA